MKRICVAMAVAGFLLAVATAEARPPEERLPQEAAAAIPAQGVSPEKACDAETADLRMARKEYREAADCYRQLTEKFPKNPAYHNKLGIAYHQLGALKQALKSYERAVKVDPTFADALNNSGTIWYQRKKYEKAVKAYRKGIAIHPEMAVLHSNLGYAYFAQNKMEEAIASFRRALAIDPAFFEHPGTRTASMLQDRSVGDRGRFFFLLAKSFAEAGNTERCLHYLRKAKEEGYKDLGAVKTDSAFSELLANPELQELLAPKAAEPANP